MAKRSKATATNTRCRSNPPWSDLPELTLHNILSRLSPNVADFHAFSGVCKAWRSIAKASKQELLASQPPMFMLRLCTSGDLRFQSITDADRPRTSLLQVKTKNCVGVSFGYLIIVDRSWRQPSLVDPFTSTTIRMPKQSFLIRFAILTAPPSSPDCLLLGWGSRLDGSRFRTNAVAACELNGSAGMVQTCHHSFRSAIFRDGKAFVLSNLYGVAVMDLVLHPKPRLVEVERLPLPARVLHLLLNELMLTEVGGELLLVYKDPRGRLFVEAQSLDPKRAGWVPLTSLGGRALFLSYNRCEVAENPAAWDGEDCMYMVTGNAVVRQSLKDASTKVLIESLPPRYVDKRRNYGWVFPISN
ncbi:uncharacterized protein LOC103720058 [Phoenix dactylifera]|uniref:Uncharacterized protein LOC103720058 n=1 Tax=Phoenix dactylifera TaxID=42345 RepID=A0A8B7CW21_PHODC|nr:uncharacterized protein LOC103720058 [Phoenix dactylifera]